MIVSQIIPAFAFAALIAAQFVAAIAIHLDADDFYPKTPFR
jgi:hypothetical protein